jgi:hypothetical protein
MNSEREPAVLEIGTTVYVHLKPRSWRWHDRAMMGRAHAALLAPMLASLALASQGCALTMSAIASHNSRGSACLASPAFGVIDLVIAGASAAGGAASDDASTALYVTSGVFGLSGLIGLVAAGRCSGEDKQDQIVGPPPPRANNTAPSFGEAPTDPEVRDATLEERGIPVEVAPPPSLTLDRNGVPTAIPAVAVPPPETTAPTTPSPPSAPAAPTCTISPRSDCPDGYYCMLVRENVGECRKIH